jgi:hypothetical protein
VDDVARAESESAYICMFSNLPSTPARTFTFSSRKAKPAFLLTIYRPFIQNNLVEKCGKVEYLGEVPSDGTINGGDALRNDDVYGKEPKSAKRT